MKYIPAIVLGHFPDKIRIISRKIEGLVGKRCARFNIP